MKCRSRLGAEWTARTHRRGGPRLKKDQGSDLRSAGIGSGGTGSDGSARAGLC